jgi:hypothetical protein
MFFKIVNLTLILCLLIGSVEIKAKPIESVKNLTLKFLGSYRGIDQEAIVYEKKYYVSKYLKLSAPHARSYCKTFGNNFDLVAFEDRNEFLVIRSKFEPAIDQSILVVVGGFADTDTKGKSSYHWISNGIRLFSPLEVEDDKRCLGVRKDANNPVAFVPISCEQSFRFMCQEMEYQYTNE